MMPVYMSYADALHTLSFGQKIKRVIWFTTDNEWVGLGDKGIYLKTANDQRMPWVASEDDLLADDWVFA